MDISRMAEYNKIVRQNKRREEVEQEGQGDTVIKDFLTTFYGKTVSMTRCEFDNYILKCVAEMAEFMTETTEFMTATAKYVSDIENKVLSLSLELEQIKEITHPEREDVDLINKRIDILGNKLELLIEQSGKTEKIKTFLKSAFPATFGEQ